MSQFFIVTPFGVRNGIDFTRVERELIQPAMKAVGFTGGTTGEIIKAGNIRVDMFQKLLVADLVVADVSIHNANAFYELGVRHAFREKRTFLIRCSKASLPPDAKLDEVPFDLKTDRYFDYDLADLASSVPKLVAALTSTLDSQDRDSPIFQLLPKLEESDHETFLAVPLDFRETVESAAAEDRAGDLSLFAEEAESFEWGITGLRLVGNTLFQMKRFELSRIVWERVRKRNPYDLEANLVLGTIYQRLGDLVRSEQALERALSSPKIHSDRRAEAYGLRGRNAKQRWQDQWTAIGIGEPQLVAALRSKFLDEAYREYAKGFEEDQNHFYSGLNALAMLTVLIDLATTMPQVWKERFDDESLAAVDLSQLNQKRQRLAGAVQCSLEAAERRATRANKADPWLGVSRADLLCLTSTRPERVASAYRDAIADLGAFNVDATRRQLLLYRQLGLLTANVNAALALPDWSAPTITTATTKPPVAPLHVIIFTGHIIDSSGRAEARFPADKEPIARECIRGKICERLAQIEGTIPRGLAGGASGGDILFHEVCAEMGIPTELFLALPPDAFCEASVKAAGPAWEKRFYDLVAKLPTRVLVDSEELPVWLRSRCDYGLWSRNNRWMLHNAMALAGKNLTLIALWNGEGGDGTGGTQDMVREVEKLHARSMIIDTKTAFAAPN